MSLNPWSNSYTRFYDEVMWVARSGIAGEETATDGSLRFRPEDIVTRAEAAQFLYRFAGQPAFAPTHDDVFSDVSVAATEAGAEIAWLVDEELVADWMISDDTFAPTEGLPRALVASLLYGFAGEPKLDEPDEPVFVDVDPGSPFHDAVVWLEQSDIVDGWDTEFGTEFRPHQAMTRAGFAAVLYRLAGAGIWYGADGDNGPLLRHRNVTVLGTTSAALYDGPGSTHEVQSRVLNGTVLATTGNVSPDGWIEVVQGGENGWVQGYYVVGTDSPAIARVSASETNGHLGESHLCPLTWDASEQLLCQATADLERLNVAFEAQFGTALPISDSYRSYAGQLRATALFGFMAATPGTSMHGWGAAIDLSEAGLPGGFSGEAYQWLLDNATGYNWTLPAWARPGGSKPEPWHFQYTG